MIINFVGNYQTGYVGEVSDESHLARELERLGHKVIKVPRDQWKAYCDHEPEQMDWVLPIKADINLIAKWDKFDTVDYCNRLRTASGGPVLYWVWDYMDNQGLPQWHIDMAKSADLYLSGELGIFSKYKELGVRPYYFQMDVCDGDIPTFTDLPKVYDVIFTGTYLGQGNRIEYLKKINEQIPITIFSYNPQEWFKVGFKECYPAMYGEEYNRIIAQSKIVLGLSVEPNCWGYWSNRVGKVLRAGGFLLQEYAPGMEQFLPEGVVKYFSSIDEAIELIWYYKISKKHTDKKAEIARKYAHKWTSSYKLRQLIILMERYLKGDPTKWLL